MIRDNLRYLIIAAAILVASFVYAATHRYYVTTDNSGRVILLDRWTGHTQLRHH